MNTIKSFLNKYILYEVTILLCLFANIIYTHSVIMDLWKWYYIIYPTSHICFFLFEGFSIYFLSFLFPRKRQVLLLILYFIVTLALWINVGYSRYFDTYMPLSLYTEFNNLNGLLPNIKDAVETSDLFFLITTVIAFFAYKRLGKSPKPRYGFLLPYICLSLLLGTFIIHFQSVKKDHDHLAEHFQELNDKRTIWDTMVERRQMMEHTMAKTGVNYYGIGLSLLFNGIEKVFQTERFHFTDKELHAINKYMYASSYPLPKDTAKNLIFILVESLSSYPINKSFGGVEITPNINRLLSTAYYNPNMESQALLGESSDGQFIYLTGLLPLKNGVTINEIRADSIMTFVSLAKRQIPHLYSQMTIPTDKYSWSQESMCKKYGIEALFSKEDYPQKIKEDWLNDKQLFEFTATNDQRLKPPFMSFILTSSMHSPYIKSYEAFSIDYPKEFSKELKHYLDNVHYMDKYLGEYLNSLKKHPWYKDCTIIITADHKPNGPKLNVKDEETLFESLPLIIINSPVSKLSYNKTILQTSIFPTILDLYHIHSKWRGVGHSILPTKDNHSTIFEKERNKYQQQITNYIIQSKYQ